jgi:hypothetical protein
MTPSRVLGWLLQAWLVGVLAIIVYRLLTGDISLKGLLTRDGDRFSPARLQLLVTTIGSLVAYAGVALAEKALPTLPDELLFLVAASNTFYLGGKVVGW